MLCEGRKKGFLRIPIMFCLTLLLVGLMTIPSKALVNRLDGNGLEHDPRLESTRKHYGIDVSSWQQEVDWNKAKREGVEFAIIRIGYRNLSTGMIGEDRYALQNLVNAKKAGLKIGAYFFSQAVTVNEAAEEANWCANFLKSNDIPLDLPLTMDYEFGVNNSGRLAEANLNQDQMTGNVISWLTTAQSNGYRGMLYANRNFLNTKVDHDQITQAGFLTWIARYGDYTGTNSNHYYQGNYNFWQYSSTVQVDFTTGVNTVDCDVWYDDSSSVNLNDDQPVGYFNGTLYKYNNGNIDWNYTGVQEYKGEEYLIEHGTANERANGLRISDVGCYYLKDGHIDKSFNTLIYFAPNNTWLYVNHGRITFSDNTLVCYNNMWFKVTNSAVDWGFNGLQSYAGANFWITNGMVNWGANGLMPYNNIWWLVTNGIVNNSYNSLYYFAPTNTWFYLHDGFLHWNDNTLVCYNNMWFKVTNSAVDWGFNGLQPYAGAQFWVTNGMVNWGANGLLLYNNIWWLITNGIVNNSYNSLYYFAPTNTWFYLHDGFLHWNDNTLVLYNNIWFKVTNSAVQWNYTGAQEFNGYRWYIQNGMLNWTYNGLALDPTNGVWYYMTNGVEDRGKDGLVYFPPNNTWFYVHDGYLHWNDDTLVFYNNAWFKVKNSAVDWSYTGVILHDGVRCQVTNGILTSAYHSPITNVSKVRSDTPIVIIGDSYSTGYAVEGQKNSWDGQLIDDFGLQKAVVSAHNGSGLVQVNEGIKFENLVDDAAGKIDPASVQYVLLLGGYNDNPYDADTIINAGMDTVSEIRKQFCNAKILIGMPAIDQGRPDINNRLQNVIRPAYQAVAVNSGSIWMDGLNDTLTGPDSVGGDHIHPTVNGHHNLAIRVEQYLNEYCQ